MGELVDRDQEHLLLLKWGFYVLTGIAGVSALFSLLGASIIVIMGLGEPFGGRGLLGPPEGMLLIMAGLVCLVVLVSLAMAALSFYAGRSVAARRRRIFCMVIAGLWCLQLSFGAVIGVCAIVVLMRPSVRALFESTVPPPPAMEAVK
jgi:hypothetical protein